MSNIRKPLDDAMMTAAILSLRDSVGAGGSLGTINNNNNNKMNKFKKGDKVKFIKGGESIPTYASDHDGIPRNMIKHGSTRLGEDYEKNFAKVVDIHNEYYILSWISKDGKEMRLGFAEEELELVGGKLRKGRKVVLIKNPNSDEWEESNPIWGKDGQYISGIITDYDGYDEYRVTWENGRSNVYDLDDGWVLKLLKDAPKKGGIFKKIKLDTAQLDKLVIEPEVKREIVAVMSQHQHQDKIFEKWGLGEVIEYGRGMTFMFHGGPGTGKTWGAQRIAKSLGMELLVIGAAEIQSSEPGGANRSIQNAFKEAEQQKKVLFIDECDSLIFNRAQLGMVLASEVNTLLTEIEKCEGVVILATNRIEHMDEALERRISLIVEFPAPNEQQRRDIWDVLLPKKMPLGKDVNVEKLSKQELTGGLIKNVILQSARLAAADGEDEVSLKHFEQAIKRIASSRNLMGSKRGQMAIQGPEVGTGAGKIKTKTIKRFLTTSTKKGDKNK